ncbi:MAG: hypothetical protein ACQGVC_07210 [Myxococcota bacterium]
MAFRYWIGVAIAASLLALAPVSAEENEQAWDQAKVTQLATDFATEAGQVRQQLRLQGNAVEGFGQSRNDYVLSDQLRLISQEARHLSRQLGDGKGRDETFPVYRRLRLLIRDAQETARRTEMVEQVTDKIAAARATLEKLEPYYPDA